MTLGVTSAAVMTLSGGFVALWRPGVGQGVLTTAGRRVFHAIARAVLDGVLPTGADAQQHALQAHLGRLDRAIAAFPAATQADLSQLLGLLDTAAGRWSVAVLRSDWPDASVAELQTSLQNMRVARLDLRQQAYQVLRELTNAAYFADSGTWSRLGYPGPPTL